jgi:hypothetical protein
MNLHDSQKQKVEPPNRHDDELMIFKNKNMNLHVVHTPYTAAKILAAPLAIYEQDTVVGLADAPVRTGHAGNGKQST